MSNPSETNLIRALTPILPILPDGAEEKFALLLDELERWGKRINLTAIRDREQMVGAHLLDSLSVRPFLDGRRILDAGTGAGFPGLPLAIAEPEREFVLLDSNAKKIGFVNHVIGLLGLKNAQAVRSRCEDYAPGGGFDTVLARALAPLPRLIELTGHLVGEGGMLLAQKGKYPAEELDELEAIPDRWDFRVTELTVPGLEQHSRHLVCLKRAG